MICLLDAIGGPFLILGGSVLLLIAALIVLGVATLVMMFIRLERHLEDKRKKEQEHTEDDELKEQ